MPMFWKSNYSYKKLQEVTVHGRWLCHLKLYLSECSWIDGVNIPIVHEYSAIADTVLPSEKADLRNRAQLITL